MCPKLSHLHGLRSRLNHRLAHARSARPSQGSALLLHCRTNGMSCDELHLLVEIRALERQRRGQALLGRVPPPQCAPRRALGPPGQTCSISKALHAVVHACRVSQAHHGMSQAAHMRGTEDRLTLSRPRKLTVQKQLLPTTGWLLCSHITA